MAKTYVLYHSPCTDGTAAAMVAKKALERAQIEAVFIPMTYTDPVPLIEPGSSVFLLDYSRKSDELRKLVENGCEVLILDHHKSAMEASINDPVPGVSATWNMEKSGAVLAWEYFFKDQPVPLFLEYVQDRDLWNWKLPQSDAFSAWLSSFPTTIEQYEECFDMFQGSEDEWLADGKAILRLKKQQIERLMNNAFCEFDSEHGVMAARLNSAILQSELGLAMLEKYPDVQYAAVWYIDDEDMAHFSLRSRKNGYDVSKMAAEYGGGGHASAAGFVIEGGSNG